MNTLARRRTNPIADMLNWFESESGLGFRGFDMLSYIRIEDYVEDGTYVLRAEMPGIDPDKDVEITVEGRSLTIRGERRDEKKDRDHREFHYGSFSRTVSLPAGSKADDITATYEDGVLELRVPIDQSAPQPQRIPVARTGA